MKIIRRATEAPKRKREERSSEGRGDTVQSLSRALSILNALSQSEHGVSLSELAHQVGLPISTTHRLLGTLRQENFVRYEADLGTWIIGVQCFIVGSAFLRSRELTQIARPLMRDLMERSGETINLAIEDRGEAIYVAQIECQETMRAIAKPGGRTAMHASGVGKALFAAMAEEEVERIILLTGLPKETPKTITTAAKLRADIRASRARGFAIDDEEHSIGLRCVAAAIFNEHAQPIAALSLSGPSVRITRDLLPKLGNAVKETAGQITSRLGGLVAKN